MGVRISRNVKDFDVKVYVLEEIRVSLGKISTYGSNVFTPFTLTRFNSPSSPSFSMSVLLLGSDRYERVR